MGKHFGVTKDLKLYKKDVDIRSSQILAEKRKRAQAYVAMNYILSLNDYFEFFSKDTFRLAKYCKYLAQSFRLKTVTSELVLYPFTEPEFDISNLLASYNITKEEIKKLMPKKNLKSIFSPMERIILYFDLPFPIRRVKFKNFIRYAEEVDNIFFLASYNAKYRFKTPIITPEILFITLMEEKEYQSGKLLLKFFSNELQWLLLRFKLIKRVYHQEINIRQKISLSQQHFAYFLKRSISERGFNELIERNKLAEGILYFRNNLILRILEVDLIKCLDTEIHRSIRFTNKRKYTT